MLHITDPEQVNDRDAHGGSATAASLAGGPSFAPPMSREQRERLFIDQLPMIRRLLAAVARQHRLSADEAEEFAAVVQLRMIVDDYAVLRKFRGRCSLRTFITVVIQRMFLDFRVAQWGKWRPFAETRRHGKVAILLERLTMRDGLTFEEACAVLEINHGLTLERDMLGRIYAQFRVRSRPRFVSDEQVSALETAHGLPHRQMANAENAEALARAIAALGKAIATMAPRDQLLLQLRFADDMPVAAIARMLELDQKWLYRRYARLFAGLRRQLESRGIGGRELIPLLADANMDTADVFSMIRPATVDTRV